MALQDLHGRTALVTGAGKRVGAAIARALAVAGCDLVVHCSASRGGAERTAEFARAAGRRALVVQANLCDPADLHRVAEDARKFANHSLAVLVHNAANFERVVPDQLDAGAWDRAMLLNATVPYRLTMALRAELREARGCVIAIACVSAARPWRNYLPYSVSKAAIVHLVRGLAVALAPEVRANAIAPGSVLVPDGCEVQQVARLLAKIPLGRLGEADDVARAVVFLAQNDFITGQVLAIDGGRSMG